MPELGDALLLMVGAAGRVPPMRAVHIVTTYPAAAAEARRMGSAMPVPFGALRDLPDGVLPAARVDRSDVIVHGASWRTTRVRSTGAAGPSSVDQGDVAGFDGGVGWRVGGSPTAPPPLVNPLAQLLDPTWLLSHRTLTLGPMTTVSDRLAFGLTAEWRDAGRFAGATVAAAALTTTMMIDAEFGFALHYEHTRDDGQPIRAETLSQLNLDDPGAADPGTYKPPPGAARTDDRDDGWARIPGWQQRLFAAAPLALGAWRVLRGKPLVPVPPVLRPTQADADQ